MSYLWKAHIYVIHTYTCLYTYYIHTYIYTYCTYINIIRVNVYLNYTKYHRYMLMHLYVCYVVSMYVCMADFWQICLGRRQRCCRTRAASFPSLSASTMRTTDTGCWRDLIHSYIHTYIYMGDAYLLFSDIYMNLFYAYIHKPFKYT